MLRNHHLTHFNSPSSHCSSPYLHSVPFISGWQVRTGM